MNPSDSYPFIEIPFLLRTALEAVPPVPQEPQPIDWPTAPDAPSVFTFGNGIVVLGMILGGLGLLDVQLEVLAVLLVLSGILCLVVRQRHAATRFAQALARHEADCHYYESYPVLLKAYHHALVAYRHPEKVTTYRKQQVAELLATVQLPIYPLGDHRAPARGCSEAYFLAYLYQHFGFDTIWANCCVPVDDPR